MNINLLEEKKMIDFNTYFETDEPNKYVYETPMHIFLWKEHMISMFAKRKYNKNVAYRFRKFRELWT